MKISNKYYPFPIIKDEIEDFKTTTYSSSIESIEDDDYIILNIQFDLDNLEIIDLIKQGKAKFIVHLEESATMYRKSFDFTDIKGQVKIQKDEVRFKIELTTFIIAVEDIINFKSEDLDIIYNDIPISYNKYNIIGIGQSSEIILNKEIDDIKDVSSIFSVIPSPEEEKLIKLRLSKERIYIELPEKEHEIYGQLVHLYKATNNQNNLILMTLIIIPAFVEALTNIKEGSSNESHSDSLWFNPLVKAFNKKNVNLLEEFKSNDFNAYNLTQIVFDEVINNSVRRLMEVEKDE